MEKSIQSHLSQTTVQYGHCYEALHNYQIFAGTIPSPFDCFLCIRGIKTLPLRVERINYNGLEVAKFLSKHKNVELVKYPGLETDPYHEIAKKYYKGCGGIVTFILKGGIEKSKKLQNIVQSERSLAEDQVQCSAAPSDCQNSTQPDSGSQSRHA